MKCPLIKLISADGSTTEGLNFVSCLEADCAWWDFVMTRCQVVAIPVQLELIKTRLDRIEEKMPHEKQFRK